MKIFIILTFGILLTPLLIDANEKQKPEKSTEEILFEPIETIITASKREQRIQDSPSTISFRCSMSLSSDDLPRHP